MSQPLEFETLADGMDHMNRHFQQRWGVPKEAAAALTAGIEIVVEQPTDEPPPPGGYPVLVKRLGWVIRNEDLGLADSILDGIRAASSAGFFLAAGITAPAEWGACIGLATSVFKLFRNALRRGRRLEPDLFTFITALKLAGPMSEQQLANMLDSVKSPWDLLRVEHTIQALKSLPMRDGISRALVSQDHDGRWRLADI